MSGNIRLFEGACHAAGYSKFRPVYPPTVLQLIVDYLRGSKGKKDAKPDKLKFAVDVGCGSGQATTALLNHFSNVLATDISAAQVEEAKKKHCHSNLKFVVSPAEEIPVDDSSVDLVTAAQAAHWFNMSRFYPEVKRVLRPGGVLALYGYGFPEFVGRPQHDEKLNEILRNFYESSVAAGCWAEERRHIDNKYEEFSIPMNDAIRDDSLTMDFAGSLRDFINYINTWSGHQKCIEHHPDDSDSLDRLLTSMLQTLETDDCAEDIPARVKFDVFILMGRNT